MAQTSKTVSVIIPTRNRPDLLKRAVASVEAQIYRDFELIVIEDTEGRGGGWARNQGIKQATGQYIAFLDDDDQWMPGKLQVQMNAFASAPPDVGFSFTAVRNVMDDRSFDTRVPEGVRNYYEDVLRRFKTFLNVTLIIKREVFDHVGMFDERFPSNQEADLMVRVSRAYRGLGINQPLTMVDMTSHEQTGRNLRRRIAGRTMLLKKYWHVFLLRPLTLLTHVRQLVVWRREVWGISKRWFRLILAAILILLMFLSAEVLLRIFYPEPKPEVATMQADPMLGWRGIPHLTDDYDANGFYNVDQRDQYDVIAIGDGMTNGAVFENQHYSWPEGLSERLQQPVYNIGFAGYGPAEYSYWLDRVFTYKPKLILVGLNLGNDVHNAYDAVYHRSGWETMRSPTFVDDRPLTVEDRSNPATPYKGFRDWLRSWSRVYTFLGQQTRLWREAVGISKPISIGTSDWTTTDPDVSLRYDAHPEQATLFWVGSRLHVVDVTDKNIQEGLRLTMEFVKKMNDQAKANRAKLVVVLIPSKESAYAGLVEASGKQNLLYSQIVANETTIRKTILQNCTQQRILCVDILPGISSAMLAGDVVYPETWDDHPTALGYGTTFPDAIYQLLSTLSLFP